MSADHICIDEINQLKEEVIILITKSKNLKKKYIEVLIQNSQKDLIIHELKEKIIKQRFQSFKEKLSANCLELIKSIDDTQKEDSSFVYFILKDIYGESLKGKSISGQKSSSNIAEKESQISPKVKVLLNEIFDERLCHLPVGEKDARRNKMSTLIRNAIDREKKRKN